MKIKLDHNLSPYLTEILKELGHDARSAREEGLSKASDTLLLYQASTEDRILFTLDKGFADVDKYPPESHAGIVVFQQVRNETIERVERRLCFRTEQKPKEDRRAHRRS